ncbi:MAG: DsrE family protein [Candidatus Eremiobacteraeota bacterium]|nr:DsrE family protein [Candidatus Eremiobacteraeota bacterium]
MNSLGFVMKSGPYSSARLETLARLALAAREKGVKVTVFLELDGVFNSLKDQLSREALTLPKDRIAEMAEKGVVFYLCSTCSAERGVHDLDLHVEGMKVGNMENLSAILGEADRVITL